MKYTLALIILIIALGGWYFYTSQTTSPDTETLPLIVKDSEDDLDDAMDRENDDDAINIEEDGDHAIVNQSGGPFTYRGVVADVSGGNARGEVKAGFVDGLYSLVATFEGLPDPKGSDFYEGWVVKRSPLDPISTGRVTEEEIGYVNIFNDSRDLIDHDFYVLTLEPDDGDPAPAAHILEGVLEKN